MQWGGEGSCGCTTRCTKRNSVPNIILTYNGLMLVVSVPIKRNNLKSVGKLLASLDSNTFSWPIGRIKMQPAHVYAKCLYWLQFATSSSTNDWLLNVYTAQRPCRQGFFSDHILVQVKQSVCVCVSVRTILTMPKKSTTSDIRLQHGLQGAW